MMDDLEKKLGNNSQEYGATTAVNSVPVPDDLFVLKNNADNSPNLAEEHFKYVLIDSCLLML